MRAGGSGFTLGGIIRGRPEFRLEPFEDYAAKQCAHGICDAATGECFRVDDAYGAALFTQHAIIKKEREHLSLLTHGIASSAGGAVGILGSIACDHMITAAIVTTAAAETAQAAMAGMAAAGLLTAGVVVLGAAGGYAIGHGFNKLFEYAAGKSPGEWLYESLH